MSRVSPEFEAALGESIAALLAESPDQELAHPSIDDWLAYRRGDPGEAENLRLQEHLHVCRSCLEELLDLQDFVEPAPPSDSNISDLSKAAVWRGVRRRLATPRSWPRNSLVAALFVGLIAAVSSSYSKHQQLVAMLRPTTEARVLHLDSANVRSGGRPAMPSNAQQVTLVLHPEEIRDFSAFRADLIDAQGQRRWQGEVQRGACEIASADAAYSFCIGLRRGFLPVGEYRVDLWGRDDEAWEKIDTFPLVSREQHPSQGSG